ncbi:hypothetical protein PG993_005914 [Apiospora rasikravindrae]|uniref:Phospholipase/carboxylesterase/thioesterase domain-containing protein n=1 Tax=Apiospora rasikravindrae TaxID=990691 RepID=A0ABR1TA49_9PEZI
MSHIPGPFIIEPSLRHTHSLILLHGLGSNGHKFGQELTETAICSNGQAITEALPNVRFIFPTAKRRRSSAFGRSMLTQWFDIASLDDPSYRSHTQIQGIEESYRHLLHLIDQESAQISRKNLFLGGLSQGCAIALVTLLTLPFPLGGFIGMSGWLPFQQEIEEAAQPGDAHGGSDPDEEDPFENPFGDEELIPKQDLRGAEPIVGVNEFTRDLISSNSSGTLSRERSAILTPVLLGHGDVDTKVKPILGETVYNTLKLCGFDVSWEVYEGQGHWYKIPDQIDDIYEFLRSKMK